MAEEHLKYKVEDSEYVIRLLSYPGALNNGRLTEEAFALYHKDEDYVSVLREIFISSISEIYTLGTKIKRWSQQNDTFYGFCELNVGRIREISPLLDVVSYYTESFPSHAGIIYLYEDGTKIKNTVGEHFPRYMMALNVRLRYIAENISSNSTPAII